MCGRSSLTKTEKEIEARFHATFYSEELERYNPLPNYNAAPTHMLPIIQMNDKDHIHLYRWGLIPSWAKDKSVGVKMINARSETLLEKPVFKTLVSSHRCIVPLDGFYEWKREGKTKIPFRIQTTDQEIFTVAGLWDIWKDHVSGETIHSFTIITIAPNSLMKDIHDRMPAILLTQNEKHWLDHEIKATDAIQLLVPYPSERMKAYEVSDKVNSVKVNEPALIDPATHPQPFQTSLF